MLWGRNPLSDAFSVLWKPIVRPEREEYTLEDLGPTETVFHGCCKVQRRDLQLKNPRGLKLECSHFVPVSGVYKAGCEPEALPCVVYLHTSMGSRLEAVRDYMMTALLIRGIAVFAFDQSGSGMSEGEYISVGLLEELDLKVVLDHLRKNENVTQIGLWGRSMGAITAILRMRRDLHILVAVLDSPFTNLRVVGEELAMGGEHIQIPKYIWPRLYEHIISEIKDRVGVDVSQIAPIDHAPRIDCPAIFAVAESDTVVRPYHTKAVYEAWGCEPQDKRLLSFSGDHWDHRPWWFCEEACDFIERHLVLKPMQAAREKELAAQKMLKLQQELEEKARAAAEEKALMEEEKKKAAEKALIEEERKKAAALARAKEMEAARSVRAAKIKGIENKKAYEERERKAAQAIADAKAKAEADSAKKAQALARAWEHAHAKLKLEMEIMETRERSAMGAADSESRVFVEFMSRVRSESDFQSSDVLPALKITHRPRLWFCCGPPSIEFEDGLAQVEAYRAGDSPIFLRR